MNRQPSFKFYATLLDAFQSYISSSEIYRQYWGNSENPSKSEDEFQTEQFHGLIDRINRVPFDSEKADRGTVFNEVIDMMILGKSQSDKIIAHSDKGTGLITARLVERPERIFTFPISVCCEFADYYKGATPQVYTEALLPTSYGYVMLYGYIDELMPTTIHDIKTTGKYTVGKYRNNWQDKVYPYCLSCQGSNVSQFEYNVAVFDDKRGGIETYTETYMYRPKRDIPILQSHCELLIDFLNVHKNLITDKKIFGLL